MDATGCLIIGVCIFIGVMYSLKRIFNLVEYSIKNKEIAPIVVRNNREERYKEIEKESKELINKMDSIISKNTREENKDLDKTIELNF